MFLLKRLPSTHKKGGHPKTACDCENSQIHRCRNYNDIVFFARETVTILGATTITTT